MKKTYRSYLLLFSILVGAYIVMFFTLSDLKNIYMWMSFAINIIVSVGQMIFARKYFQYDIDKRFLRVSIFQSTWFSFVYVIVVGIISLFLQQISRQFAIVIIIALSALYLVVMFATHSSILMAIINTAIGFCLFLLLLILQWVLGLCALILYFVFLALAFVAMHAIEDVDDRISSRTQFYKELNEHVLSLTTMNTFEKITGEIAALADEARYASPASTSKSETIEKEIEIAIKELNGLLLEGNINAFVPACDQVKKLIKRRNELCKR